MGHCVNECCMSVEQIIVFIIIFITLVLFIWGRWRYDLVALAAVLAGAFTGVIAFEDMFLGFGHPAVITVAAVLIISEAATTAGIVDVIARLLTKVGDNLVVQLITLTALVAVCSAFMNNVGALALIMPVAIWLARKSKRSPSLMLMPIAFGSLLGGMLTLIGTPPNIIISEYMEEVTGTPFAMFDFLPVGLAVAAVGVIFIALLGWRFIPQRGVNTPSSDLFSIQSYMTEVVLPKDNDYVGRTLHDLIHAVEEEADISVIAMIRGERRITMPSTFEVLRKGDILMIEGSSDSLKVLLEITGIKLAEDVGNLQAEEAAEAGEEAPSKREKLSNIKLAEVIVAPGSMLVGTTLSRLAVRERYGMNVLAVARQGYRLRRRVSRVQFLPGDILLIQGKSKSLPETLQQLGCLPLAARSLSLGRPRKILLTSMIFFSSIALISSGLLPVATALVAAALLMVLTGIIAVEDCYKSVDIPVIVLLAAMIPVGGALESTGGSALIAQTILHLTQNLSPVMILLVLMSVVMVLTNVINNAAAVILAAPIALNIAEGMGYAPEPFLMAVAVASSSAFLTPIGHQSNTLVMAPGGYEFGDYWRMGLPLSLLVLLVSIPVILWWFPV